MSDTPNSARVLELVDDSDRPPEPASGLQGRVPDFAPGSLVAGKYLVEGELGEGGIGVVVRAKHVQLDQSVVIKYLKPLATTMPGVVERFVREARLAAKIKSDHAVKVYDVDMLEGGVPYMVMEFLEGRDLGRWIQELGPLPPEQAADFLLQACEALAEAHAAGIVHRDLKPDNLFVAERAAGSSIVKILDFGISKVVRNARSPRFASEPPQKAAPVVSRAAPHRDPRLTQAHDTFGTPAFMSPEQIQSSAEVDARADIWALGVSLYELVTGRLPFEGELPELARAILTEPPVPMRDVWPDARPEVEAIVLTCLEKDREKRYRNVAELAQALVQVFTEEAPSRVKHIVRVINGGGQLIRPPTPPPGSIKIQPFPTEAAAPAPPPMPVAEAMAEVEMAASPDRVIAVFTDAAGALVDELQFVSIDEAYQYACLLEGPAVRCDLYEEFADVRGKRLATYQRKEGTEHWVPFWA